MPNYIRDAPDTVFARYPVNPKARYWISDKGQIPDIRLALDLTTLFLVNYQLNLY
jgi:hypothetical protein